MRKARLADDGAFDLIFQAECRGVVRAAYLVTGDWAVAQEIAQDAFAELFVRWDQVRDYDKPGAWVRRVAIRRAVRARGRRRPIDARTDVVADPSVTSDRSLDLHAALAALPPRQRAVLVLHYLEDLPVDEIATALGCSTSTVKVHLHRGRRHLQSTLPDTSLSGDHL